MCGAVISAINLRSACLKSTSIEMVSRSFTLTKSTSFNNGD